MPDPAAPAPCNDNRPLTHLVPLIGEIRDDGRVVRYAAPPLLEIPIAELMAWRPQGGAGDVGRR